MTGPEAAPPVHRLGEVFNEAGVPEITYVAPAEARQIKASLATPGKHVTLVGPSGSGKSTVAHRILEQLEFGKDRVHVFNGRSYSAFTSIFEVFEPNSGLHRKSVKSRSGYACTT